MVIDTDSKDIRYLPSFERCLGPFRKPIAALTAIAYLGIPGIAAADQILRSGAESALESYMRARPAIDRSIEAAASAAGYGGDSGILDDFYGALRNRSVRKETVSQGGERLFQLTDSSSGRPMAAIPLSDFQWTCLDGFILKLNSQAGHSERASDSRGLWITPPAGYGDRVVQEVPARDGSGYRSSSEDTVVCPHHRHSHDHDGGAAYHGGGHGDQYSHAYHRRKGQSGVIPVILGLGALWWLGSKIFRGGRGGGGGPGGVQTGGGGGGSTGPGFTNGGTDIIPPLPGTGHR